MEFSSEAREVFKTVMKVQGADAVLMAFENMDGLSKFRLDVKKLTPKDRVILIDDIPVVINKEDEKSLKNIRFIVQDNKIMMESKGGCACCTGCNGCN